VIKLPKILIFIDWYLPGFRAGGPIQSCANLVSHLKHDFDFFIITRNVDYTASKPYDSIKSNSWNDVKGAKVYYLPEKEINYKIIKRLINEAKPDVIYINGIYSFYFSILPLVISKILGYHKILIACRGMLAPSAIEVKGFKKKLFLKFAKLVNLYSKAIFHATNIKETVDIRTALGDNIQVRVAPNLPEALDELDLTINHRTKTPGELLLVSIARISQEKNLLFALNLLSSYSGNGKIMFDLFGPIYDESYWKDCERIIVQLPSNINVTYKGILLKEKVHSTLQNYHILFMPSKGENFGHIILESFMAGSPVLISDQTPWVGLYEKAVGYSIPLDNVDAYHTALDEVLQLNQYEYDQLSCNAYSFALSYNRDKSNLVANKALFDI
jgi:hypothetical protein